MLLDRFASLRLVRPSLALAILACAGVETFAQTNAGRGAATPSRRDRVRTADAAMTDADKAAGRALDSLFADRPPTDPLADAAAGAMGVKQSQALRRSGFEGTLVHNPDQSDGNPPYALTDRYGGIVRYVEPVPGIELDRYVGQTVGVLRDTGHTLLASQLNLPRTAGSRPAALGGVTLAQHVESVPPGMVVEEGAEMLSMPEGEDPLYLDDGLDFHSHRMHMDGGCPQCGSMICPPGGCGFGARPIFYARGDYMLMWAKGMQIPPLVVRGEVNDNNTPAVPGDDFFDNAFVVYGNEEILKRDRSGGRVILGYWLDDYGQLGIEGEYLGLGNVSERFTDGGNGTFPIVGRPFIDATTGFDAVEDVSFPGIMGTVTVDSESQFQSAGIRLRRNLCCASGCGPDCGDCVGCGSAVGHGGLLADPFFPMFARGSRHVDFLAGVRWVQLKENLRIVEDLEETATPNTTFLLTDNFATSNEFFGGGLGFIWEWRDRRWALDVLTKMALGNNRQQVAISGSTLRDRGTTIETLKEDSGLLAQPSNVGVYDRNVFAVVPEIGVTLGYDITQRLRFNVGYSFIYWSRVARPGEQIDLEVNPDFLDFDPDAPPVIPARPRFEWRDSDFWVQGVTLGFLYQY